MRSRLPAAAIALAGFACVTSVQAQVHDWRRVATAADRTRLRDWRDAWMEARAKVDHSRMSARMNALGPLLDPDLALSDPIPPAGAYRCRIVKLGARMVGAENLRERGPIGCSVEEGAQGLRFAIPLGPQRVAGDIFADERSRAVFLGTLMLGDERHAMAYGRDATRDMAGRVERIGERRWRIVLPYPRFESMLDVIELTPA